MAATAVEQLDSKNEWKDFPRFYRAITVRANANGAGAALADSTTAVALAAAPGMGEAPDLSDAQYVQHSLRSLIRLSLDPEQPAAKLISGVRRHATLSFCLTAMPPS